MCYLEELKNKWLLPERESKDILVAIEDGRGFAAATLVSLRSQRNERRRQEGEESKRRYVERKSERCETCFTFTSRTYIHKAVVSRSLEAWGWRIDVSKIPVSQDISPVKTSFFRATLLLWAGSRCFLL